MALQVDAPFPPTPLAREDVIKLVVRGCTAERAFTLAAGSLGGTAGGWTTRTRCWAATAWVAVPLSAALSTTASRVPTCRP